MAKHVHVQAMSKLDEVLKADPHPWWSIVPVGEESIKGIIDFMGFDREFDIVDWWMGIHDGGFTYRILLKCYS